MLTSKQKQEWIAALRSKEYTQGKSVLHCPTSNNYCCLGVLAHINNLPTYDGTSNTHFRLPTLLTEMHEPINLAFFPKLKQDSTLWTLGHFVYILSPETNQLMERLKESQSKFVEFWKPYVSPQLIHRLKNFEHPTTLAYMNDSWDSTFEQIALFIEHHLPVLDPKES